MGKQTKVRASKDPEELMLLEGELVIEVVTPIPDIDAAKRLRHTTSPARFQAAVSLSRLALAVDRCPSGAAMFRTAAKTDHYPLTSGEIEKCIAEAEALTDDVNSHPSELYVALKLNGSWRIAELRGFIIDPKTVDLLPRPHLLIADRDGRTGTPDLGISNAKLYQPANPESVVI